MAQAKAACRDNALRSRKFAFGHSGNIFTCQANRVVTGLPHSFVMVDRGTNPKQHDKTSIFLK
jgi:hypothetical protein